MKCSECPDYEPELDNDRCTEHGDRCHLCGNMGYRSRPTATPFCSSCRARSRGEKCDNCGSQWVYLHSHTGVWYCKPCLYDRIANDDMSWLRGDPDNFTEIWFGDYTDEEVEAYRAKRDARDTRGEDWLKEQAEKEASKSKRGRKTKEEALRIRAEREHRSPRLGS